MKFVTLSEDWKKRFDAALGQIGFYKYGWKHSPEVDGFAPSNSELCALAKILIRLEEKGDLYSAWVVYSAMYDRLEKDESTYLYKQAEDGTMELVVDKLEWSLCIPDGICDQLKVVKDLIQEECKDSEDIADEMCRELAEKGVELTVQEIEAAQQMVKGLNIIRQATLQWNGIRKLKEEQKGE